MASEFCARRACIFRRLAGGKSCNMQDVTGAKGTVRRAARLCGDSYTNLDLFIGRFISDSLFYMIKANISLNRIRIFLFDNAIRNNH